jgi:hypothetical protein
MTLHAVANIINPERVPAFLAQNSGKTDKHQQTCILIFTNESHALQITSQIPNKLFAVYFDHLCSCHSNLLSKVTDLAKYSLLTVA